jgi:hypothetical protein
MVLQTTKRINTLSVLNNYLWNIKVRDTHLSLTCKIKRRPRKYIIWKWWLCNLKRQHN